MVEKDSCANIIGVSLVFAGVFLSTLLPGVTWGIAYGLGLYVIGTFTAPRARGVQVVADHPPCRCGSGFFLPVLTESWHNDWW
jgi:hypothetical protein